MNLGRGIGFEQLRQCQRGRRRLRGVSETEHGIRPIEVLAQAGYQEIGAVGEPFDPARHQALAGETRDGRGAVVELYATGLACFGQVAVPAQVRVSSNGPSSEEIKPP